ncbi:MAG TPA: tetratricopeptide repeat protein [Verrucomicrobiae bacterium]
MAVAAFVASHQSHAQSPEESSVISTNLSDLEFVQFAKAEPKFAAAAFDLVQSRIVNYADAAGTSYRFLTPSNLRLPRTLVPPRSLALTNAIMAARLFVDFTTPPEASLGETAVTWNEIGYVVLERASAVLHHYYLAVEYRTGHEASLTYLRQAVRDLATYLTKRADSSLAERLQITKARYAALWFEKCEDVLPVYKEVLGGGARGVIREALVFRNDLPLVTGWTWDQRKRAENVHKQFVEELTASSNNLVKIEGLLLATARSRTDKGFTLWYTNALHLIDVEAQKEASRSAYAHVLKDLVDDRYGRNLLDKTRNDLRTMFEVRFLPPEERSTNIAVATVSTNTTNVVATATTNSSIKAKLVEAEQAIAKGSGKVLAAVGLNNSPEKKPTPAAGPIMPIPGRPKAPLSWQVLNSPADIRYWENMPVIETRALAKEGDVVANYYLFLKLRNSEKAEEIKEANTALQKAFKAELPQAILAYAKRETDAEERFHWTKKAATTGYPAAQLALGELHILGHGTPMDLERGLGLVRAAYDLKVPDSETVLAELYAAGIGAPRNTSEKPAALFMAAAHDNHPKAMLELHERYLFGYLVVRDQLEASRWILNAGIHNKEVLDRYLDDDGKSRTQPSADLDSFAKTLAVYGQALVHKQPEALKSVAEWYQHGSVGRKSAVRAYALASLVQDKEKISPQFVEQLKAALTPHELRTAELLVTQWAKVGPDLM